MTFEEDFPSLKYKYYLEVGTYNPLFQCVEINEIQEHCLEKQKVKDWLGWLALKESARTRDCDGYGMLKKNYLRVLKELNLEE